MTCNGTLSMLIKGLLGLLVVCWFSGCSPKSAKPMPTDPATQALQTRVLALQKQITEDPYNFDPRLELGLIYFRSGEYQSAIDELAVALTIDSGSKDAHAYHGLALLMTGNYFAALTSLQNAALLDPRSIELKNNLGFVLMKIAEFDQAIDMYQQVLKLDPDNKVAHLNLGVIYRYDKKNFEQAITHYTRYLELEPDSPQKLPILQWIKEQQELLAKPPLPPQTGENLSEEERRRSAMQHFNDGLDAYRAARFDDAFEQFTQAVSMDPWNSAANYYMALSYCRQARMRLQRALDSVAKALVIEPTNERYGELKATLEEQYNNLVCP